MPRPTAEHYDLSDTEKRDLIKLIEHGKPLPDKYRFLLFAALAASFTEYKA